MLRAGARLRRRQGSALRVREVPRRGHHARHADEGRRRGDGDRPHLQAGLVQGRALARGAPSLPRPFALRPLVPPRDRRGRSVQGVPRFEGSNVRRFEGSQDEVREGWRRSAASPTGEGLRPFRRGDRGGVRHDRGGGPLAAPRARHPAGVPRGRHLRRRVRGGDAVFLFVLRVGRGTWDARRGNGGASSQVPRLSSPKVEGPRPRRRAEPDRAGHRVRLVLLPRGVRAAGAGVRGGDDELEPRDGLHRLRHERPALLRAADVRGRDGGLRARGVRRRDRAARGTDPAQPRRAARGGGREGARHLAARHRPPSPRRA